MALVWVVAFALVAAYYRLPAVAEAAKGLQSLKASMGLGFAAVAGFVAGGILPELAKALTGRLAKGENPWGEACFRGIVWIGLAVMVDIFYGYQASWFGTGNGLGTLAVKTAVDMFIFAPLIFVPYTVGMFVFRREKWRISALFSTWTPAGWKREVFPTYVPNVCFWIVVLLAVYALPTDLQYPMSALATACWSILFTFLVNRSGDQGVEAN
ncbi:MAG: hypothetical protein ABL949_10180 [Fimbriimonadaceae bacterium]